MPKWACLQHAWAIFKFPRSTLASKIKSKAALTGREGLATIKMVKLLAQAQRIVDNSTSDKAEGFDTALWLDSGWNKPSRPSMACDPRTCCDTETGTQMVHQLLGAMESGAYL